MKDVYFIAGLGADGRAFSFLDLSYCRPHFINWIKPAINDTLASYSERLFEVINDERAIIVGLSFGGMLATEIAKNHPETTAIVISSAKTYHEIPAYLRFWRYVPVYKLHSNGLKKRGAGIVMTILGTKGIEQKKVNRQILQDSDPLFVRWAVHAIVNWKNATVPKNVIHIHGTADKLLPFRYVKADHIISKGEHVMVMDHHEEISEILKQIII